MRAVLFWITLLSPLPAMADCPGEVVLGCMIGEKTLEICADASVMSYSFGPKGAPELSITAPMSSGPVQPWPGWGGPSGKVRCFRTRIRFMKSGCRSTR